MDLEKEEVRPEQGLQSLPQERHIWRMPELPPIPQMSVPTNFDVSFGLEIIEVNVLRAEPLSSGSHRKISVPIQKLVQSSKRRGVGNIPKPLAGGHELILTHQGHSGSGEDNRTLRRVEPIVLQRKGQKDKELVEEPKSFICRSEDRI
ncbi:hypothetical protein O181_129571 [Austropuccinia psidii MF-1]|uniref:Uncharacterized protein n=1 Tax=Austropuccinia psidii MF-1 TaxID=1389203 RepID=A0A9Q3L127_9BASI|nr:hypothetical protein [Austropuccinia psidii MF-1]